MKIKKRTGGEEYFSQLKTYRSMIRAGATERMSRKISHEIDYHVGITTTDVRKNVLSNLNAQAPEVADNFECFKKNNTWTYY